MVGVRLARIRFFSYANRLNDATYDVSQDGRRFLMIKDVQEAERDTSPTNVVVVLNWTEELKLRLPQK